MGIPYKKQFVKSDGRKLTRSGPRDMQARIAASGGGTDTAIVEFLTNQIAELKSEILAMRNKEQGPGPAPSGFFTAEQVDNEIRHAVEAAVSEAAISFKSGSNKSPDLSPLVKEYKTQIVELQKSNDNLTRLHATITKENSDLKNQISKLEEKTDENLELSKQIAVLEQELAGKQEMIEMLKVRPAIIGDEAVDPDRPKMEQVFVDPLEDGAGNGLKSTINIETINGDEEVENKVDKLRGLLGKLPKK